MFEIVTAKGETVRGVVDGAAGYLISVERMRESVARATKGQQLAIHEPQRGHVRVYLDMDGSGEPTGAEYVDVDIRGAVVCVARWGPGERP